MTKTRIQTTICALAFTVLALPVRAVEFLPSIAVSEIYTNNVELAPSGQEQDAWITRIAPSLRLLGNGQNFNYELDYTLEGLLDASDSSRNAVYHQLGAVGLLDVIGKSLQLRGQGNILQVNVAPEKATTNSNIFDTGNRTNAIIWNAGPLWDRKFGESEVSGFVNYGKIYYDNPLTQDITTLSGNFTLRSDRESARSITYELAYNISHLRYELSGTAQTQSAYLRLGYRVAREFEVFGLGGADNDFADPTSSAPKKARWEVGAATVLAGGRAEAAVGHRFFGTTYRFNWGVELPESAYNVTFTEEPTTTDITSIQQLSKVTPGVPVDPGALILDPGLGRPGTLDRFILKHAGASGQWKTYRATLRFGVVWEERINRALLFGTPQPGATNDERSYGFEAGADWQFGLRSVIRVLGGWRHRDFEVVGAAPALQVFRDRDSYYDIKGNYIYRLGEKTELGLGLAWDSRRGTAEYDQFLARLDVNRRF